MLIPNLGLMKLGDNNIAAGFHKLITTNPEKMNAVTGSGTPSFATIFTGILLVNTFYWCCNQQIVQRAFGAKNLKEGQKGVLYAGFIKFFVPFMLVIPGVIAFHLYSGDISHPDMAYSVLVANVLPTGLIGFFGAVLFGAVLSSFNSPNSASTMFCINVYKPIINPNIDDQRLVKIGKIFGTVIAIFAILVAPQIAKAPDGLYTFMKSVMGFFRYSNSSGCSNGICVEKNSTNWCKNCNFLLYYCLQLVYFLPRYSNSLLTHVRYFIFMLCNNYGSFRVYCTNGKTLDK